MLIAWNEAAPAEQATARLYLGESPRRVDLWGNTRRVEVEEGKHVLRLDRQPLIITGIDAELAQFRASFALDPAFIESTQRRHRHNILLRNPWPVAISGAFTFTEPENWTLQPGKRFFSIGPGQTAKLPVAISFPLSEVAGVKALRADVQFQADKQYAIEASAPLELGLRDIEFSASLLIEPGGSGGENVLAVATIHNRGEHARTLYAFASLPRHPRQERLITRLEPGQTMIRRFRFNDAVDGLSEHGLRIGIRETRGPAVLTHRLQLDEAAER